MKKKLVSLFLALAMVLSMAPAVYAEPYYSTAFTYKTDPVKYIDANGVEQTLTEEYVELGGNKNYYNNFNQEWSNGQRKWCVVSSNQTIADENGWYIYGELNLILADGATLTINPNCHICVLQGASLHIYGQENDTGVLTVNYANLGIEGVPSIDLQPGATLTINGGTVNSSTSGSPGIGSRIGSGAGDSSNINVVVNRGTVNASGNPGIGHCSVYWGTDYGNLERTLNLTVNGGTVNATGGINAAGIGYGHTTYSEKWGSAGTISKTINMTVNGGTVTATGGEGAVGLGFGGIYSTVPTIKVSCTSNLDMNGGTFIIQGGSGYSAIGIGPHQSQYVEAAFDVDAAGGLMVYADAQQNPVNATCLDRAEGDNIAGELTQRYVTMTAGTAEFNVTAGNYDHGSITAAKAKYGIGETVPVTVNVDNGYQVTDAYGWANSQRVNITDNSFVMPIADVALKLDICKEVDAIAFSSTPTTIGGSPTVDSAAPYTVASSSAVISDGKLLIKAVLRPKAGNVFSPANKKNRDGTYSFPNVTGLPADKTDYSAKYYAAASGSSIQAGDVVVTYKTATITSPKYHVYQHSASDWAKNKLLFNGSASLEVYEGEIVTVSLVPNPDGYIYQYTLGTVSSPNETPSSGNVPLYNDSFKMPASDVCMSYGFYMGESSSHQIVFESNNNEAEYVNTVTDCKTLPNPMPTTSVSSGDPAFLGWYYDDNTFEFPATAGDSLELITGYQVTLYAKWGAPATHANTHAGFENAKAVSSNISSLSGVYYLTADVSLLNDITISGDVDLCLNGHVLDMGAYSITVPSGASLNICDCDFSNNTHYFTYKKGAAWTAAAASGDAVQLENINNPGVTLTDNSTVIAVSGGVITGAHTDDFIKAAGTLNLYGVNVIGETGNACVVYSGGASGEIDGCTFAGNYSSAGVLSAAGADTDVLVSDSTVTRNTANGNTEILVGKSANISLIDTAVTNNEQKGYCGAAVSFVMPDSAEEKGTLTLGGATKVSDNYRYNPTQYPTGGVESNVFVPTSDSTGSYSYGGYDAICLAQGVSAPTSAMIVGVSLGVPQDSQMASFASGEFLNDTSAANMLQSFASDDSTKHVDCTGNVLSVADGAAYKVTINAMTGGSVTADKTINLVTDDVITLTVQTTGDYKFKSSNISVADGDGAVTLTPVSGQSKQFTFTIGTSNATVDATFILPTHWHENIETDFTKVMTAGTVLSSGDYYLSNDVMVNNDIRIAANSTVNLCLNGCLLNLNGHVIIVEENATFNIYDCNDTTRHPFMESSGIWSYTPNPPMDTPLYSPRGGIITGGTGYGVTETKGGAIYNQGTMTVDGVMLIGNQAGIGGAIYNEGTMVLNNSAVWRNHAVTEFGGVVNEETMTLGGTSSVIQNTSGTAMTLDNLVLYQNKPVTLDNFTGMAGVKVYDGSQLVGGVIANNDTAADLMRFTSEDDGFYLKFANNHVTLIQIPATFEASLSLEQNIKMNFYAIPIGSPDMSKLTLKVTFNGKEQSFDSFVADGTKYRVSSIAEIYSYQMTLPVNIKVYYDGDLIKTIDYSVRDYCDKVFETYGASAKEVDVAAVALCKAALDYGAQAQLSFAGQSYYDENKVKQYYQIDTSDLANKITNATNTLEANQPSDSTSWTGYLVQDIAKANVGLVLASETAIKFYVQYSGTGDMTDSFDFAVYDEATDTEIDCTVELETKGDYDGWYSIKVSGISAFELANKYRLLIIRKGTAIGDNQWDKITASAMTYARAMWTTQKDNTDNICKALVNYMEKAKAYKSALVQ